MRYRIDHSPLTAYVCCREKLASENADFVQLLGAHASSKATETLTLLLTFDGYLVDDSSSLRQQLGAFGFHQVALTTKEEIACRLFLTTLLCVQIANLSHAHFRYDYDDPVTKTRVLIYQHP